MQKKYLRTHEVRARYGGIGYTTLWRRCRDGSIPKPEKLGNLNIWDERRLDKHDAERGPRAA